jgi:hypothetical protein
MKHLKKYKDYIKEGLESVKFKGKNYSISDAYAFLKIWEKFYFSDTHNDCLMDAFLSNKNYKKLGYFRAPDLRPMMNSGELDDLLIKLDPYYRLRGRLFNTINLIVIPKWELEEKTLVGDLKELKNHLEARFRLDTKETILEIDNGTSEIGYRFYLNDFIENFNKSFNLRKYNVGSEINEI